MLGNRSRPRIPLPKQWPSRVRSGVLYAIALTHFSLTYTRSWAANSLDVRAMLGRAITATGKAPRHLVCDRGPQFDCDGFRGWCRSRHRSSR